jgi:hypothetical protein
MTILQPERWLCYFLLLALLSSPAYSQKRKSGRAKPPTYSGAIPFSLDARLNERLKLYVECQRNNQWDKVAELLGEYLGGEKKRKLMPEQKRWLLEKLREKPMVNFTRQRTTFSTWILGQPLEARYWDIEGTAEYQERDIVTKERAIILAYLDQGEWFFTPRVIDQYGWRSLMPPGI